MNEQFIREELRKIRKAKKLSLNEAGAPIGMSAATLSYIENGHNRLYVDTMIQIAESLGYNVTITITPKSLVSPEN